MHNPSIAAVGGVSTGRVFTINKVDASVVDVHRRRHPHLPSAFHLGNCHRRHLQQFRNERKHNNGLLFELVQEGKPGRILCIYVQDPTHTHTHCAMAVC